jgi:hypothetical protein
MRTGIAAGHGGTVFGSFISSPVLPRPPRRLVDTNADWRSLASIRGFPFSGVLELSPMPEKTADERGRMRIGPLLFLLRGI